MAREVSFLKENQCRERKRTKTLKWKSLKIWTIPIA